MKIGIFDSGVGGTTVMAAIKERLPGAEYLYIGDSANCPYGEKTDAELKTIVDGHVRKLRKWGADVVVIACNTATTRCIEWLRDKYPDLPFVGTEPAVKIATESGAKKVLVMATLGTIESERMEHLVVDNRHLGQKIDLLACPGLADVIEDNMEESAEEDAFEVKSSEIIREKLKSLFGDIDNEYDVVVLGCTHYSLIKDLIREFFADVVLVDGNEGVARRVRELTE